MSNLSENKINVTLAVADVTAINDAVNTILSKVPGNTTLTDEQRLSYNAINVANKVFADDCLTEAQVNGEGILPGFINLIHLKNDLTVFEQLDQFESALNNIVQRIADAKRIAGHELLVKLMLFIMLLKRLMKTVLLMLSLPMINLRLVMKLKAIVRVDLLINKFRF